MLLTLGSFIVLLGVLVFVHELGHFLVAKACGVKVQRFSIGFGPKLFGFTRGETEYQVALLPLGGYVKMAGDNPHEELPPEEAQRGFLAQPPWKRGAIVLAGPLFNLIFPVLVYFFVFVGQHETEAARVGSLVPGLPAAEAGLQPGDRILAVEGEPVRSFSDMRRKLQPRFGQPIALSLERDGRRLEAQLTPARAEEGGGERIPRGMIGVYATSLPAVVGVPAGSAAEAAGLRTFDRILTINGTPAPDEVALRRLSREAEGPLALTVQRNEPVPAGALVGQTARVVELRVPRTPGAEGYAALGGAESANLYVAHVQPDSAAARAGLARGDRLVSLNGQPLKSFELLELQLQGLRDAAFQLAWRSGGEERQAEVRQQPLEVTDELGKKGSVLELGVRPRVISPVEITAAQRVTVRVGVGEALRESVQIVPEITGKTVQVLGQLITGEVPHTALSGPVGLARMAAKSAEQGLDTFLNLMAVVSINLGVMNLLPIPILDGFHLLAALWEGVRRRPIPVRAREIANMVGLVMLLLLMFVALTNDLTR